MSTVEAIQTTKAAPSTTISGMVLQRKCACGGSAGLSGECEGCKTKKLLGKPLQKKLAISQPGDEFEQEADRIAEQIMRAPPAHAVMRQSGSKAQPLVQCRASGGATGQAEAPPIVQEVLNSPGQPLDSDTRDFFEPRFGHDFSQVRVHTDAKAGESARSVNALAYTVGKDVVVGAGYTVSGSGDGRRLLAHELSHVVQQGAMTTSLQRACLSSTECSKKIASTTRFVSGTTTDSAYKAKHERRQSVCSKIPPDPACTGDGHGAEAVELVALLTQRLPNRVRLAAGIFIDKDMSDKYGAYEAPCNMVTPPKNFPGEYCVFVPDYLEQQAKQYNITDNVVIGRKPRQDWLTETLEILTHETEHARFSKAPDMGSLFLSSCSFDELKLDLSELAADVAAFRLIYRRSLTKPDPFRQQELDRWFQFAITNPHESIEGILMEIRCACDCADADKYLKKTIEFSTTGWNSMERFVFHTELRKPQWHLNWPIEPPATVAISDVPSSIPLVDIQDLPKARS